MHTSNFARFFFRLYWCMNSCISFRNLKLFQDQYQAALKDLPATRQAGFTLGVQALLYNTNFMVSNSFAQDLMNTLVPENIAYSNLTVYEKTGSLLTSIVSTSNIYIRNEQKSSTSLFPSITAKVIHFLDHVKSQTKVTQLSSIKSMFIPLMSQNLVIHEDTLPILDHIVDTMINIGEGEIEGIDDMINGMVSLISKITSRFHGKKEYLLNKLIETFTATGQMEEENAGEHAKFAKLKGTKSKIIMNWIATIVDSQLRHFVEDKKIPILSIFGFLAATVTSKDEKTSGNMIEYVVSRCSNSDLDWIYNELKERLSKLDKS